MSFKLIEYEESYCFPIYSFVLTVEIPPRSGPRMIILLLHTQYSSTTAVQTHKLRSPVSKWPSPILPWEKGGEGMFTYFHPAIYDNKQQDSWRETNGPTLNQPDLIWRSEARKKSEKQRPLLWWVWGGVETAV